MAFEISKEQLDALDSDYMTRDAIAVITNAIRTSSLIETKESELKLYRKLQETTGAIHKICHNTCLLYKNGIHCDEKCPFVGDNGMTCNLRDTLHSSMGLLGVVQVKE